VARSWAVCIGNDMIMMMAMMLVEMNINVLNMNINVLNMNINMLNMNINVLNMNMLQALVTTLIVVLCLIMSVGDLIALMAMTGGIISIISIIIVIIIIVVVVIIVVCDYFLRSSSSCRGAAQRCECG